MDKIAIYKYAAIIVSVGLIMLGCLIVLLPFLPALLLAAIFCISTWPAFRWLQTRLRGHDRLAASLMTALLAVCFVAPLVFLGSSLADSFSSMLAKITQALQQQGPAELPVWIQTLPFLGAHIEESWHNFITDRAHITQNLRQYASPVSEWLIVLGTGIGHGIIDLALGIFISYFFFRHGPVVISRLRNLIERFGGKVSLHFLSITESTMISLVYGILGTALVLGTLATVGFYIADIPGAPFLGLLTFLLGIVPGGPPLVLIPVTLWLFYEGQTGMGIFMGAWSATIIIVMDLIIRPYFISLGSKMPLILVLLGVFGGVISFGFIGLFIGPALLSVAYAMITEWSQKEEQAHG